MAMKKRSKRQRSVLLYDESEITDTPVAREKRKRRREFTYWVLRYSVVTALLFGSGLVVLIWFDMNLLAAFFMVMGVIPLARLLSAYKQKKALVVVESHPNKVYSDRIVLPNPAHLITREAKIRPDNRTSVIIHFSDLDSIHWNPKEEHVALNFKQTHPTDYIPPYFIHKSEISDRKLFLRALKRSGLVDMKRKLTPRQLRLKIDEELMLDGRGLKAPPLKFA